MPFSIDSEYRSQFITGLHALADYLAADSAIPVPAHGDTIIVHADSVEDGGIDQIRLINRFLCGTVCDETGIGGHFTVTRSFGPIVYEIVSIPDTVMARYHAHMSYRDNVIPVSAASDA